MPRKRSLSKTLSPQTRSAVKRAAEVVDPPREQIAFRRGPPPKNAKVINGNDQTDGSTGPSAAHQQQNVTDHYQSPTKFELELEIRLLKAELKQRDMMDEIKDLKHAKMEQQKKEEDLVGQIQELKDGQKKCLDKCEAMEKELARKLGKLLKAELKQGKMMDEIKELKDAKMEQQQKEDAFIGHIQKSKAEQKKCLDKYNELEKELARKYICIGQFAKLLTRIDQMEAQINELKEKDEEEASLSSSSVPAAEDDDDISEHSDSTNRQQMQIRAIAINGTVYTLNVRPSNTIKEIKAKIKNITGIPKKQQRLTFDRKQLEDGRTLAEYNIRNGDLIHIVLRLCGC
ncbi:hypothetical protein niasHT_012285 [Heterodera trifolii]|uniref:Ubiquitin-like domain-containing protein n=1 Tax=Heterodera trifolii TaxID=157864 RepID=A0ABD2LFG5_9BILA